MKKLAKPLSILLVILLLAGVVTAAPLSAFAEGEDENPVLLQGSCGVNENSDVEYYCFKDNSMAIFGTGAIRDYALNAQGASSAPWYGYDYSTIASTLFLTKIAIEYGVTAIGDYSFYLPDQYPYAMIVQLNNIDIANTVTSIGSYAFYNQKIETVTIPPTVTHIGANAFKKCALSQNGITYYGDPAALTWDSDAAEDTEFSTRMRVHILSDYSAQTEAFNERFAYKNIEFVADMSNPYAQEGELIDRNIAVYYGSVNSHVFGGAAPFIIIGRFDGKKKSVTYGSNGFASCVKQGNDYYILTNIATGALNKAVYNATSGKATGCETPARSDLKLFVTHEYIGTNTVKMIYTLKNTGSQTISGLKLGGTGDIKIGADDFAAISPLYEEANNDASKQIGFYMKSGKNYDKSSANDSDYATLGFIGKNVGKDGTENYPDAHFFYGKADANKAGAAAGSKTLVLLPERVFSMNGSGSGTSHDGGAFNTDRTLDSAMSYYWDNDGAGIALAPGEEQEYAVLFSVYGASDESAYSMIEDLEEDHYYTVTWKDYNGTDVLARQVVTVGEAPHYPGQTPVRSRDAENNSYEFSGWDATGTVTLGDVTYDSEFTARYTATPHPLFCGHSLTLRGDVGVNFFVDVTPEQVRNGVTIHFDWPGLVTQHAEYTLSESDCAGEINGKVLYRARCNVPAAEMTDVITATAYFNGVKYTKEEDVYSVYAYGKEIINPTTPAIQAYRAAKPEAYAALVALIRAMLDYGTKAQIDFDHNNSLELYANKDIGYTMDENVSVEDFEAAVMLANGTGKSDMSQCVGYGLEYATSSVVYLTTTTLRLYFKVTDRAAYDSAKANGTVSFCERKLSSGYVYAEVTDIPAADLDKLQPFAFGTTTCYYSVLDYAEGLLDIKYPDSMQKLGKALYRYSMAANAYFEN